MNNYTDIDSNVSIILLTTTKNPACNLFTQNKQFSVLIDGVNYPTQIPLHKNVSINFKCLDENENKKLILFYNTWFGSQDFEIGRGYRTPFKNIGCPVTSCETTSDKTRLNDSDIVITHMRDSIPEIPKYRPKNQRWLFLLYVLNLNNVFKQN